MKRHNSLLLAVVMLEIAALAQDAGTTTTSVAARADGAKSESSNSDLAAAYSSLSRQVIELDTRFRLLVDLAKEHRKRAEASSRDQPEKTKWESELAKEMETESATTLAQLNRVATAEPLRAPGALGTTNDLGLESITYLLRLDERMEKTQRELAAILEEGRVISAQLATNLNSYDFARVSAQVQENGNLARQIQKEQSDLELRRLEFLALRRR